MPRRLSFTRLNLFEQPLVFIASSFILGLLFAARFVFNSHVVDSLRSFMADSLGLPFEEA